MSVLARFHLMTIDKDGQVNFDKKLLSKVPSEDHPEGILVEKQLPFMPSRGHHITLDVPNLKKYMVWSTNLVFHADAMVLEVELLDPDETSVYPKMR